MDTIIIVGGAVVLVLGFAMFLVYIARAWGLLDHEDPD